MIAKDYRAAAKLVSDMAARGHTSVATLRTVRDAFIQLFSADNSAFQGGTFYQACNIPAMSDREQAAQDAYAQAFAEAGE